MFSVSILVLVEIRNQIEQLQEKDFLFVLVSILVLVEIRNQMSNPALVMTSMNKFQSLFWWKSEIK